MRRAFVVATLTLLLVGVGDASAVEGSRFREAVRSGGGVISSESPAASAAGPKVPNTGGNAMDAAAASTLSQRPR